MIPVPDPAVAIVVLLLLHMPPGVASLIVMLWPGHTKCVTAMIAGGSGLTVTVAIPVQTPGNV